VIGCLVNIGQLFVKAGRTREAEASLRKAFDLAREVGERTLQKDAAEALYEGKRAGKNRVVAAPAAEA